MTATVIESDTLRQADLLTLREVLNQQRARAFDVVIPASQIEVEGIQIRLQGIEEPIFSPDGLTDPNGLYSLTNVALENIADKLDIRLDYLRRCYKLAPHLFQANVKGWLDLDAQVQSSIKETRGERKFLMRCFRSDTSRQGVLRAMLSDQYRTIDHLDMLLAALKGIQDAGVEDSIIDADLTDRRMVVRVVVPKMAVYAEEFLQDYRNPFTGEQALHGWTRESLRQAALREGHKVDDKVIFAGFEITNSEVGGGAFRITPRVVIGPCTNGLKLTAEAMAKTHLGGKLDEGVVQWSEETLRNNLALITSQATDAVKHYLNVDFVTQQIEQLTEKAATPITEPKPVIVTVCKKLGFTERQTDDIFNYFIRGGQATAGGIMQAVTALAQVTSDGDVAYEMETAAMRALDFAVAAAK